MTTRHSLPPADADDAAEDRRAAGQEYDAGDRGGTAVDAEGFSEEAGSATAPRRRGEPVEDGSGSGVASPGRTDAAATSRYEGPISGDADAAVPPFAWGAVGMLAALIGVFVLIRAPRYPYFGDELYFLAAGRRPALTYLDQGPVVPLLARLADSLAPDSLLALRFPAVLAGVAAILVTAALAREFGGGRRAQVLAALAYATSPFFVSQTASLSTFAFDATLTATVVWLLTRWIRTRRDHLIAVAALALMIDLQVKWSAPTLLLGLALGVALVGPRPLLRVAALWYWAGAVFATVLPAFLWQSGHGWPQLAMGAVIRDEQLGATGGGLGLAAQIPILAGLLGTVLAAWGCAALARGDGLRPYRCVAIAFGVQALFVFATGTRPYFVAGYFPALFAAGAVAAAAVPRGRVRTAACAFLAVAGVAVTGATVLALPRPLSALHTPSDDAHALYGRLRTYGSTGWPSLVDTVESAYRGLPRADREHSAVVAHTYWQAGALEQLGGPDLPGIYSPNRGFAGFGPPPDAAEVILYVAPPRAEPVLRGIFGRVEPVAVLDDPLGFPGIDRRIVVWRCEDRRRPWDAVWPELTGDVLDNG